MSRRILRIQRMHIRRMVATWARMCRLALDEGGEDTTLIITTAITAAFAMAGIRGMDGGDGE
jgi:hypothetical protein